MCGRYTLAAPDPASLRARFPIGETVEIRRRFNVAPGDEVLAVTADREGQHRGELLRWGLVPHWAQQRNGGPAPINARAETLHERPAFRDAFRCLILADGFYEWQSRGASKQAFHIARRDARPFAFAGLWSINRHGSEELRSCAIVTAAANPAIAPLHDRMPVILHPAAESSWLDPATPESAFRESLAGLSAEETALRPVGPAVNDARYDGPKCLAEPVTATLF